MISDVVIVAVGVVLLTRAVSLLARRTGVRVSGHGTRSRATAGELRAYVASLRLRGVRSPGALAAAFRYRQRHPGGQ